MRIPQPMGAQPPPLPSSERYAFCRTSWNPFHHTTNLIRFAWHALLRNAVWLEQQILFLSDILAPSATTLPRIILITLSTVLELEITEAILAWYLRFPFFCATLYFFNVLDRRYVGNTQSWAHFGLGVMQMTSLACAFSVIMCAGSVGSRDMGAGSVWSRDVCTFPGTDVYGEIMASETREGVGISGSEAREWYGE